MRKKKVLIFIDWYLPGLNAGGPVRTCANLVSRLNDEFDFLIATRNTDLNASLPYSNVQSDEWNQLPDGSRVYYFSQSRLSYSNIRQLIADENPDIIHLNSLFSLYFTILPLIAAKNIKPALKVVAGPRGMLSKGALAIKPFKKQLFIALAKLTGLFSNVTWHASTPIEAEEIKQAFGQDVKIKLGIDLAPAKPIVRKNRIKKPGELSLFYLGRISPVKNLLQCIDVLKNINNSAKVNFDIYGPVEDAPYWKQCQEEIKKLPSTIQVSYKGLIAHEKLDETITQYHFLMLLTENENYGHAIVESLTCGCPVIISNRTPWRSLEKISAGWDLELEKPDEIIHALEIAVSMDQVTYDKWSGKAYDKGIEIAENAIAVEENKNLFR